MEKFTHPGGTAPQNLMRIFVPLHPLIDKAQAESLTLAEHSAIAKYSYGIAYRFLVEAHLKTSVLGHVEGRLSEIIDRRSWQGALWLNVGFIKDTSDAKPAAYPTTSGFGYVDIPMTNVEAVAFKLRFGDDYEIVQIDEVA